MGLGATLHDLFGGQGVAPGMAPQPTGAANPVGVSLDPSVTGMMNQAPAPAHRGSVLMGIIADALAGAAGHEGPYAAMLQHQRQQADEEAQWSRRQASQLQGQRDNYLFEQQHKAPDSDPYTGHYNALEAIQQGLGSKWAQSIAASGGAAFAPWTNPATGEVIDKSGGSGPQFGPAAPQGVTFSPIQGGPTHPASGGFRRY